MHSDRDAQESTRTGINSYRNQLAQVAESRVVESIVALGVQPFSECAVSSRRDRLARQKKGIHRALPTEIEVDHRESCEP